MTSLSDLPRGLQHTAAPPLRPHPRLPARAAGANIASLYLPAATAAAASNKMFTGGLLGLASTGGVLGVALCALLLTARTSFRWMLGAAVVAQFAFLTLLASPVLPGVLPVKWLGTNAATGRPATVVDAVAAAWGDPARVWVFGVAAAAAAVVLLARLPVAPDA